MLYINRIDNRRAIKVARSQRKPFGYAVANMCWIRGLSFVRMLELTDLKYLSHVGVKEREREAQDG